MNDARNARPAVPGPVGCRHLRFTRVGIQRAPMPPYCLYLLTCRDCGTTLTTLTIRDRRHASRAVHAPAAVVEEETTGSRRRRRAG